MKNDIKQYHQTRSGSIFNFNFDNQEEVYSNWDQDYLSNNSEN